MGRALLQQQRVADVVSQSSHHALRDIDGNLRAVAGRRGNRGVGTVGRTERARGGGARVVIFGC